MGPDAMILVLWMLSFKLTFEGGQQHITLVELLTVFFPCLWGLVPLLTIALRTSCGLYILFSFTWACCFCLCSWRHCTPCGIHSRCTVPLPVGLCVQRGILEAGIAVPRILHLLMASRLRPPSLVLTPGYVRPGPPLSLSCWVSQF